MSDRSSAVFVALAGLLLSVAVRAGDPPSATVAPADGAEVEVRRGVPNSGSREDRDAQFYQRVIGKIEPSLKGDIRRVPQYLELYKREFVEDLRTFAFDVSAQVLVDEVTLSGHIEFPEHRQSLASFFKWLGIHNIVDQTEMLPSETLGERVFGLVTADRAYLYDRPSGQIERLTECTQGDVLFLLKEAQMGQILCHAPDGYVGYIDADDVRRIDEATLTAMEDVRPPQFPQQIEKVIDEAMRMMGAPYVWGGVTQHGLDCSGLVRQAFKAAAINLPRDADQQALAGRLVAMRWYRSGLRRGDTLYFLGRRGTISHTGIYLGDNKYIEATEPVVKISSFNPDDPEYVEKRDKSFCFGKRVIE